MKQGSLFSYFKKSDTPSKGPAQATPPPTNKSTSASSSNKKRDVECIDITGNSAQAHKKSKVDVVASASVAAAPAIDQNMMLVGKKIEVWWTSDNEWYSGTLTTWNESTKKHLITYDDGDREWIDLTKDKYRVLNDPDPVLDLTPPSAAITTSCVTVPSPAVGVLSSVPVPSDSKSNSEGSIEYMEATGKQAKVESKSGGDAKPNGDRKKAKKRIIDDSSDEENQHPKKGGKDDDEEFEIGKADLDDAAASDSDGSLEMVESDSDDDTYKKKTPAAKKAKKADGSAVTPAYKAPPSTAKKTPSFSSSTPKITSSTKSVASSVKGSAVKEKDDDEGAGGGEDGGKYTMSVGSHMHNKLPFLLPENRMDKDKRRPDHPEFNPHTLYIPDSFLKAETPAMKQWWEMKRDFFDTLLFFKVGKFYEIFHMDADVGVRELEIIYMKGEKAHCGFPEIGFSKFSEVLIDRGYRVARVEQTETPDMLKERNALRKQKGLKADSVVSREICSLVSKGTRVSTAMDALTRTFDASFLFAIVEVHNNEAIGTLSKTDKPIEFGVAFVDSLTGVFELGQFKDDVQRSRFRTLIAKVKPAEVAYIAGSLSHTTLNIVKHDAPLALHTKLNKEHWCKNVIDKIKSKAYYSNPSVPVKERRSDDVSRWPGVLRDLASNESSHSFALDALGGIQSILERSLIDHQLFSMRNISMLEFPDVNGAVSDDNTKMDIEVDGAASSPAIEDATPSRARMALDGVTLLNLQILENEIDGKVDGTLLKYMDHTQTAFGKRMIRTWVAEPLMRVSDIEARLDAVEELMDLDQSIMDEVRGLLKSLPDLERLLARFHALGSEERSKNHPDGRAILYEMGIYNTRNIDSFIALIEGFETARKIINKLAPIVSSFKSKLLIALLKITTVRYEGLGQLKGYPDYASALTSFRNSFDINVAKAEKKITPKPGTDVEYEEALVDEKRCIKALNDYLDTMKNRLGCRELKFWGRDKDRFQLEVPDAYTRKCSSDDGFTLKTATKNLKRYYTEESLELFDALKKVEARKTDLAKDTSRRQFNKFSEHYYDWMAAVCCLANLDSLFSLALTSKFGDGRGDCCRPEFVHFNDAPDGSFMEVRKMRHPCVKETYSGSDFIPNDIILGNVGEYCENKSNPFSAGSKSMLLTGPNMGGKSTLLRQACIAAIIAQIGCYVPAAKVRLTPVDRVFTRIGASDRILAGQSTFFVELTETAQIMQYATPSSLIILDELGRGTSTFDGAAIAFAVMKFLCQDTQARTMFSTHYHSLVESFMNDPNVSLGHMGCIVSKATDGSDIDTVTFLYQLKEGTCDRSYGLNVARLAHLPEVVIQDAKVESANFETRLREAMASKSIVSEQTELVQSLLQMNIDDEEDIDSLILKANALTAA